MLFTCVVYNLRAVGSQYVTLYFFINSGVLKMNNEQIKNELIDKALLNLYVIKVILLDVKHF